MANFIPNHNLYAKKRTKFSKYFTPNTTDSSQNTKIIIKLLGWGFLIPFISFIFTTSNEKTGKEEGWLVRSWSGTLSSTKSGEKCFACSSTALFSLFSTRLHAAWCSFGLGPCLSRTFCSLVFRRIPEIRGHRAPRVFPCHETRRNFEPRLKRNYLLVSALTRAGFFSRHHTGALLIVGNEADPLKRSVWKK